MSALRLYHYSAQPIEDFKQRAWLPDHPMNLVAFKPAGVFWFSVDGDGEGWPDWIREEMENREDWTRRLRYRHRVALTGDARVLTLDTADKVIGFAREYGIDLAEAMYGAIGARPPRPPRNRDWLDDLNLSEEIKDSIRHSTDGIRWGNVADNYDVLIFAPYFYGLRMNHIWYNGIDCASGFAFDTRHIMLSPAEAVTP